MEYLPKVSFSRAIDEMEKFRDSYHKIPLHYEVKCFSCKKRMAELVVSNYYLELGKARKLSNGTLKVSVVCYNAGCNDIEFFTKMCKYDSEVLKSKAEVIMKELDKLNLLKEKSSYLPKKKKTAKSVLPKQPKQNKAEK